MVIMIHQMMKLKAVVIAAIRILTLITLEAATLIILRFIHLTPDNHKMKIF